ncbi:hypothetical protein [Maribacter sp. 2-571]|uniref:hypothetical protein n=1 Tax=Maribacter sp. 2-571 TaxID=3417569 RepID=UPI003D339530
MKKIFILLTSVLLFSCNNDQESSDNIITETINYSFDGKNYKIEFIKNQNQELETVESIDSKAIDNIIENNENLIFHDVDEHNIMLFATEEKLEKFLFESGRPLSKKSNVDRSSLYSWQNLAIHRDSYLNSPIPWAVNSLGNIATNTGGYYQYCTFAAGSNEDRLKNLALSTNWRTVSQGAVYGCPSSNAPNDQISSVSVRNVFARFYEDANYRGRSIVRDARYGSRISEYSRLKSVRYRGRWDNRISSIKLSN